MKRRLTNRMKIAGELRARDLNPKAWKFYSGTSPLDIYEDDTDPDNVVYHVRGYCEIDNMTFSELEDMLTESQAELEECEIWVCSRESGDRIEKVLSMQQGREIIADYERTDREDGNFAEKFYAICLVDRYGLVETIE